MASDPPHDDSPDRPPRDDRDASADDTDDSAAAGPHDDVVSGGPRDRSATASPATASPPSPATVDSRWWYVVAAVPVLSVAGFAVGLLFFVFVFLLGFAGAPGGMELFVLLFVFGIPFALLGGAVALAAPVALYFDAEAVTEAGVGWEPDAALYAVAALAGLVVPFLQPGVALYYLYQRHQHVGTP